MAAPVILLELQPRRASDGVPVTVRLAGGGGTKPYFYFDEHWRAGIAGLPTIISSLDFPGNDLGVGGVPQALQLSWRPSRNSDLAEWANYIWTDAPFTLRIGPESAPPPIELSGKVLEASTDTGALLIALSDAAADLKRPLLVNRYAGTGDLEGPSEWEGVIKRRVWGRAFNIKGELIDGAHWIYAFGDSSFPWAAFDVVRDKGAPAAPSDLEFLAWQGTEAATLTALRAAEAPQGGGVLCPSICCVKWWTEAAGDLCADIRGEYTGAGYVETAPAIAERIVGARSAIPFAAGTIAAAAAARPGIAHFVADDESTTIGSALDELLGDVSMLWVLNANDAIELRPWSWGAPVAQGRSVEVKRRKIHKPVKSRRLGYRRNNHVMSRGDIAGIVFATDVAFADGSTAEDLKPAEGGATRGAPAGTPVAGIPAEDVADTIGEVKDPDTGLAAQKVRIDEILVDVGELIDTYGSTASAAASAAAAEAAKLAAQGAETNANGYAGAAAASAASADASEAGAASSALVAAQWGNDARWAAQPNRGFDFGLDGWACFTSGAIVGSPPPIGDLPAGVVAAAGYWGETGNGFLICPTTVSPTLVSRRMFPVDTSRKYRFRTRVGAYNTGSSGQNLVTYLGFIGLDKDGNYVDHGGFGSMRYCLIDPVIANVTWSVPDGQMRAATAIVTGEGNDTWQKFPPGTKNIRLICLLRYSGTGPAIIQYLDYLDFEDVTESQAAGASASAAASSAASAGAQAALAQSSAILSAQIGGNSLTRNPTFADQDAAGGLGAWNTWTAPTSAARIAGSESPYAHRMVSGAANAGYYQSVTLGPGDYIVEGTIALSAGARIEGAGIFIDPYAGGSGTAEYTHINFARDTTVSGEMLANGSLFSSSRLYRFSRLIRLKNPGTTYLNIYMMNNWTGFGETLYAKTLDWHRCSIRPASEGETLGAQVKTLAGAVATLQGKAGAYWQTEVNAGAGATAFMQAKADSFSPQDAPLTFRTPTPQHIQVVGRDIRKTGGGSASWDVGVWSQEAYTAGAFVSFIPGQTTAHIMMGLNGDPQTSSDYNDIDYAMYCTADGTLLAYESGGGYDLGITYKVGDRLSVEYIDSTVFYKKNGKTIRAVATTAGRTFYMDSSFYTAQALARSVTFSPSGPTSFSSVAIGADEISLWNPAGGGGAGEWKKAASVQGGNAMFAGDLSVGGSITVGDMRLPVAIQSFLVTGGDGSVITFGGNLADYDVLFNPIGLSPLSTSQIYDVKAVSKTPTGFTVWAKKVTPGSPATVTSTGGSAGGAGNPLFVMDKSDVADAYNGAYTFNFTIRGTTATIDIPDDAPINAERISVNVSLYVNSGSGWVLVKSTTAGKGFSTPQANALMSLSASLTSFYDAIGQHAGKEFGITVTQGNMGTLNSVQSFDSVGYQKRSTTSTATASPSGEQMVITVVPSNVKSL